MIFPCSSMQLIQLQWEITQKVWNLLREYVTAEVEKGGIAQAIRHYGLDGRGGQDTK